eukprot:TRINITY_DN1311_c2_g1_i1.p1 TRINITY_DN1311_c2_g1~~TRINITY_DN1311_c2_g1_i1.p1  ORF type:complete len:347 (+),score=82.72 TRINITY_DN1311_c2_g1_i1:814-1854(+)
MKVQLTGIVPDAIFADDEPTPRLFVPARASLPLVLGVRYGAVSERSPGRAVDLTLFATQILKPGLQFGFIFTADVMLRYKVANYVKPRKLPDEVQNTYNLTYEKTINDVPLYCPFDKLYLHVTTVDTVFESNIADLVAEHGWREQNSPSLTYAQAKTTCRGAGVTFDDELCCAHFATANGFLRLEWRPQSFVVAWMIFQEEGETAQQQSEGTEGGGNFNWHNLCTLTVTADAGQRRSNRYTSCQRFFNKTKTIGGAHVVMEATLEGIPYEDAALNNDDGAVGCHVSQAFPTPGSPKAASEAARDPASTSPASLRLLRGLQVSVMRCVSSRTVRFLECLPFSLSCNL